MSAVIKREIKATVCGGWWSRLIWTARNHVFVTRASLTRVSFPTHVNSQLQQAKSDSLPTYSTLSLSRNWKDTYIHDDEDTINLMHKYTHTSTFLLFSYRRNKCMDLELQIEFLFLVIAISSRKKFSEKKSSEIWSFLADFSSFAQTRTVKEILSETASIFTAHGVPCGEGSCRTSHTGIW